MINKNYEVEVLVNGKPLKEYDLNNRIYVEGREKTRFSIRIRNNSSERKLFVPTIDGLSVMDGEEASFESSGYIVQPHTTYTIDGWRVSDNEVAEFYFSSPDNSYRKRMKKGNNLGVIGVAVFKEKVKEKPLVIKEYITTHSHCHDKWCGWCRLVHCNCKSCCGPFAGNGWFSATTTVGTGDIKMFNMSTSSLSASAPQGASANHVAMASMKSVAQDLGTGWGDYKKSEVTTVSFDRCEEPDAVLEIYYNTRQQLEALGVDFKKSPVYVTPQAFPGQYCKPPQN